MSFLDRVLAGAGIEREILPFSFDDYQSWLNFQGTSYPFVTGGTLTNTQEQIAGDFLGLVQGAYKGNGVVFACMMARALLFSEARFQFRRMKNGTPGDLFGSQALKPLESPWVNAQTGDLLMKAITDVDLAGNFYAHRPGRRLLKSGRILPGEDTIRRLRPDWVTIVLGSQTEEEDPAHAIDCEVAAYIFHPGGMSSSSDPIVLAPEEVAHWAPYPDPIAHFRGMSWITPVLRDIMGDGAASQHKLKFFEQGGTPNMVVTAAPAVTKQEAFDVWMAKMKQSLGSLRTAYQTLYLQNGAEAKVVGADLKAIDFRSVQGAGETRIAAAAGIPPIIVGLSEGLAAGTYNNYGQARRRLADGTMRPLWRTFTGSISTIIDVPPPDKKGGAAELWYDEREIKFLQEDVKDAADIQAVEATTIHALVSAGFESDSVVAAVLAGDFSLLKHSGLFSVQLQPAGSVGEGKGAVVDGVVTPKATPASAGASDAGRVLRALLEDK